jgi:hypothetical protein
MTTVTPGTLAALIEALRVLPGVGPKSAARMAYHLLQRERDGAGELARALSEALARLQHCALCNNFAEAELCELCASPLAPDASRLISGFCSSPRSFGLGFLQTPPRDDALALLLAFGSAKT